jgi:hypothetical protein
MAIVEEGRRSCPPELPLAAWRAGLAARRRRDGHALNASCPSRQATPLDTAERGGDAAAYGVAGIHRAHVAVGALVVAGAAQPARPRGQQPSVARPKRLPDEPVPA